MSPGIKYISASYPKEPKTIGQHIKKKRIDLDLIQKDVAQKIGVSEDCITYWENGRSQPQIQYAPAIIDFLGFNPWKREPKTLGDRVWNYRHAFGLSQKSLGKKLNVDASTVASWEANHSIPSKVTLNKVLTFFKTNL